MNPSESTELDRLLAHAGWARALARSLVRDAHRADDLVQRAWVAAIEPPPERSTPVRRWLAAVMRNFARQDARADARRGRRKALGARDEALPAHDSLESGLEGGRWGALEDEAELQERLLDAVRALDEPYRSTIWARYYEGLAPRAIAARDGVPLKTVKTRLHRGLNELRLRFDRDSGGDRRAWLAALMPLAKSPSLSATTLGAILVSTELKVACGLVAVVVAVAAWRFSVDSSSIEPSLVTETSRSATALEAEARREPKFEASDVEDARAALAPQKNTPGIAAASATGPVTVDGRVLDLEQHPVAGVAIVLHALGLSADSPSTEPVLDIVTGRDGRFELASPQRNFELGVRSEAWVEVYAARLWSVTGLPDVTIFVAPRRPLAGVIVDRERRGIAHADVEIRLDAALRRDLGTVLDANIARSWEATSDANGRFELPDAPQRRITSSSRAPAGAAAKDAACRAVSSLPRRRARAAGRGLR
jgi:RNA polymerase sigma factor (sigma-70 family)